MIHADCRGNRYIQAIGAQSHGNGDSIACDGLNGSLDAGSFTVVLFSLGLLFMSLRRLNTVYAETQRGLAAAGRVFEMMDAAPRLKAVGRAGVGVDNIDLEAATARGVPVLNAPAGNTIAAAELELTDNIQSRYSQSEPRSPICMARRVSCRFSTSKMRIVW